MKDFVTLVVLAMLISCWSMFEVPGAAQRTDEENDCPSTYSNLTNDIGIRIRRETTHAIDMSFAVFLSESVVQLLGKQNIVDAVIKFLHESYMINPRDVFHFVFEHADLVQNDDSHLIRFVLGPEYKNISEMIWSNTINFIDVGGFRMQAHTHDYRMIPWDGLKTIVSFEITTDEKILYASTVDENRIQVVNFLTGKFDVRKNQLYDVNLVYIKEDNARIEFSLAPAMGYLDFLLFEIEAFVNKSCHGECEKQDLSTGNDICSTCDYVSLADTLIRPVSASFVSKSTAWTGNEIRFDTEFEVDDNQESQCGPHQESCKSTQGTDVCVGIGKCDPFFYNTIILTIPLSGQLAIFDFFGLDYTIESIIDIVEDLFGLCKHGLHLEMYEHGRMSTTLRFRILPSIGRTDSLQKLYDTLNDVGSLTVKGFTITLAGEFTFYYLDNDGPPLSFIANDCFGCTINTVWCLLPKHSLCMPLLSCVEQTTLRQKIANDTDLVRVSLLLNIKTGDFDVTDSFKEETRIQFADQLNCSLKFLDNILMAPSEFKTYEMRLDVVNQGSISELENLVHHLHVIADAGMLYIETSNGIMTSMIKSVIYRQMIYGFTKETKKIKQNGDYIVLASFLPLVIVSIVVLIIPCKSMRK